MGCLFLHYSHRSRVSESGHISRVAGMERHGHGARGAGRVRVTIVKTNLISFDVVREPTDLDSVPWPLDGYSQNF